jgi:hypothetical protein
MRPVPHPSPVAGEGRGAAQWRHGGTGRSCDHRPYPFRDGPEPDSGLRAVGLRRLRGVDAPETYRERPIGKPHGDGVSVDDANDTTPDTIGYGWSAVGEVRIESSGALYGRAVDPNEMEVSFALPTDLPIKAFAVSGTKQALTTRSAPFVD